MKIKYTKSENIEKELMTPDININECYLSGSCLWETIFIGMFRKEIDGEDKFYKCVVSDRRCEVDFSNFQGSFEIDIKKFFKDHENVKIISKKEFKNKLESFKQLI